MRERLIPVDCHGLAEKPPVAQDVSVTVEGQEDLAEDKTDLFDVFVELIRVGKKRGDLPA